MNKPSVGATILWWLETIVSIRVLLFTVPVMINRQMTAAQPGAGKEDGFILMITVAAALYLFTGLAATVLSAMLAIAVCATLHGKASRGASARSASRSTCSGQAGCAGTRPTTTTRGTAS